MYVEPWIFVVAGFVLVSVLPNVFMFGVIWQEERTRKDVEKVLNSYYPLTPKVEINNLKWKIREELGIEQPKHARRPYY